MPFGLNNAVVSDTFKTVKEINFKDFCYMVNDAWNFAKNVTLTKYMECVNYKERPTSVLQIGSAALTMFK